MSVSHALRTGLPLTLLVAAAFAAAPTEAGSPKEFFELSVTTDEPEDYAANGALDIEGVHMTERFLYDSGNRSGHEIVQFRIQLRERDQIKNLPPQETNGTGVVLQPIEYTVGFKADGKETTKTVVLTQRCLISAPPGGSGLDCNKFPPTVPKPHRTTSQGGVVLVLNRTDEGLAAGTVISDVWAASALVTGEQRTYHDVVPGDNADQPHGSAAPAPETSPTPFALTGTFPFLTMELLSSTQQYVVPGGTTSFVVKFRTHEAIPNGVDHIYVDFQAPASWRFEGNLGNDFITTGGGQEIEYEVTVKAPPFAKAGEELPIRMDATMSSMGGHQTAALNVRVTGTRVEAPEYTFNLLTPGPFKAEAPSLLRWEVAHEGVPLERFGIAVDFLFNGKVIDRAIPATEKEPGVYEATYTFTSGGAWTADVYVAELEPAPHATFAVTVASADGGLLPGFGLLGAWMALGLAAWRRRL